MAKKEPDSRQMLLNFKKTMEEMHSDVQLALVHWDDAKRILKEKREAHQEAIRTLLDEIASGRSESDISAAPSDSKSSSTEQESENATTSPEPEIANLGLPPALQARLVAAGLTTTEKLEEAMSNGALKTVRGIGNVARGTIETALAPSTSS